MKAFFTDLDNTIIYSHRHQIAAPKRVAEYLHGHEQSYMNEELFRVLSSLSELTLIPVTTRSEEQYRRLICMEDLHVKYALLCNGGKLLIDGKEDRLWQEETLAFSNKHIDDLERAYERLTGHCDPARLHRPELFMCYAGVDNPIEVYGQLKKETQGLQVDIAYDHRKVYLFAKGLNKGLAIKRFKQRFSVSYSIACGDSEMDIPMLNEVDLAMASNIIFQDVTAKRKMELQGEDISLKIAGQLSLVEDGIDYL